MFHIPGSRITGSSRDPNTISEDGGATRTRTSPSYHFCPSGTDGSMTRRNCDGWWTEKMQSRKSIQLQRECSPVQPGHLDTVEEPDRDRYSESTRVTSRFTEPQVVESRVTEAEITHVRYRVSEASRTPGPSPDAEEIHRQMLQKMMAMRRCSRNSRTELRTSSARSPVEIDSNQRSLGYMSEQEVSFKSTR